jgi:curved DNA-binding protein CbpA
VLNGAGATDHYALLGVRRDASPREIRRAYRRLARQHHPDLNPRPDGPDRFAELAHAYAILNDADQRARYDQMLHRPVPTPPLRMSRSPVIQRAARRGILELSPGEARHLAHRPLRLSDGHGRTVVVPAGAGHGSEITLHYDGLPVILTIHVPGKVTATY